MMIAIGLGLAYTVTPKSSTLREYATHVGERRIVLLQDGTRLTLGPLSRVRIAPDYGRRSREVTLNGEAYFAVVHDSRHPFAVLTNNVTITNVGTEFNVRGYNGEVRVAVAKGEVMIGEGRPGQMGGGR